MAYSTGLFARFVGLFFFATCWAAEADPGDRYLLGEALDAVLGHLRKREPSPRRTLSTESSIRQRCSGHLACESPIPGVDVDRVMFLDGEMHVAGDSSRLDAEIAALNTYYGAKAGHLPSSQVQLGQQIDWIAGPKIVKSNGMTTHCQNMTSNHTATSADTTHALFLFPWEAHNAFHALNDNVLSVLANVITHYLHTPRGVSALAMPRYKLYTFQSRVGEPKLMFRVLPVLFGRKYVQPASTLLRGGPHCVHSLSWVSAIKPFYKDTLVDLRRASYDVLRHVLSAYSGLTNTATEGSTRLAAPILHGRQLAPAPGQIGMKGNGSKSSKRPMGVMRTAPQRIKMDFSAPREDSTTEMVIVGGGVAPKQSGSIAVGAVFPRAPRLVIVTRLGGSDPARKINPLSELALLRAYERLGFSTEICCDFSVISTVTQLLTHFLTVDVCVGIHGAGLSNCVFGRPGMTIVELQTHHGYGTSLFHKIAHMAGGQHLFYDIRNVEKMKGVKDAGFDLTPRMIEELTTLTARIHFNSGRVYNASGNHSATITAAADGDPDTRAGSWWRMLSTLWRKLSNLGAPAIETEQSLPPLYPGALQGVLVVAPAQRTVYVSQPHSTETATAVTQLLGTMADGSAYPLQPLSNWVQLRGFRPSGNRRTYGWEFAVATIQRNRGTYWVQLNPSRQPYTMESILGPRLEQVDNHCRRLLYLQFRHMTYHANESNYRDCDKHTIVRKRTGRNDHMLLQLL